MKRIIITIIGCLILLPAFSQEQELSKKEKRQLEKQMKKEAEAEAAAQNAKLIAVMVEYQRFVLEADQLRDAKGNSEQVSSTLNFVACDSINGVIQIGQEAYVGMNGVGGITVEGPISNYKYTHDEKRGVFNVTYNVRSSMGNYDVRLTAYTNGRADATISSSWPGKLNYSGFLVPPMNSRVYKGTSY